MNHRQFLIRLLPVLFFFSTFSPAFGDISRPIQNELRSLRTQIRSWAPLCADGTLTFHECPFGDALEYMGLLCLSGEPEYCEKVRLAQDSTGRFWRSPGLVGIEEGLDHSGWASFSRDMAHGVWAYLIATQDRATAIRWIHYIESHDHRLCPRSKRGSDACVTRATFWTFAGEVFDWLGIPRTPRMKQYKYAVEALYAPIEARFQPMDYQMLLTAETVFAAAEMAKRGATLHNRKTHEKVAQIIHHRQPENPFYRYLVYGADETTARLVLKYCPRTKPVVPITQYGPMYPVEFGSPMDDGQSQKGGGHLCLFMINLLIGAQL
jgi:hypothetical protein